MSREKIFKLKGKTLAIVDWANVYGWFKNLKWEIDTKKLYEYLKTYPEIYDIRFYFGIEKGNKQSEEFHRYIKKIGYTLISKEVKWVPVNLKVSYWKNQKEKQIEKINELLKEMISLKPQIEKFLYRRKCDFDVEITRDVLLNLDRIESLILFSGDGDYAPLIEEIIKRNKQAILVFARGCKGKEYENFKKGLYQCSVKKLRKFIQK